MITRLNKNGFQHNRIFAEMLSESIQAKQMQLIEFDKIIWYFSVEYIDLIVLGQRKLNVNTCILIFNSIFKKRLICFHSSVSNWVPSVM